VSLGVLTGLGNALINIVSLNVSPQEIYPFRMSLIGYTSELAGVYVAIAESLLEKFPLPPDQKTPFTEVLVPFNLTGLPWQIVVSLPALTSRITIGAVHPLLLYEATLDHDKSTEAPSAAPVEPEGVLNKFVM